MCDEYAFLKKDLVDFTPSHLKNIFNGIFMLRFKVRLGYVMVEECAAGLELPIGTGNMKDTRENT